MYIAAQRKIQAYFPRICVFLVQALHFEKLSNEALSLLKRCQMSLKSQCLASLRQVVVAQTRRLRFRKLNTY